MITSQWDEFKEYCYGGIEECNFLCRARLGSELTNSDKRCLAMCHDRYREILRPVVWRLYQKYLKEYVEQRRKNYAEYLFE